MTLISLLVCGCGFSESDKLAVEAEPSCGFVQDSFGRRVAWPNRQLQIALSKNWPSNFKPAVENAVNKWNSAIGYEIVELLSEVDNSTKPAIDKKSVIYWMQSWPTDREFSQGTTQLYFNSSILIDADIKINAKNFSYFTDTPSTQNDYHIESLLIHELGHALGLKHVDGPPSVMAEILVPNYKRLTISASDKSSVECEYKSEKSI